MNKVKVGINGMGRIGRNLCRVIVSEYAEHLEIAAVNDLVPTEEIVTSLRRDTVYGAFPSPVVSESPDELLIGSTRVRVFNKKDATEIPWKEHGVELVFDCSGFYLIRERAQAHLSAGATMVIMSAPPKDDTPIFVVGVNDDELTGEERIISNASCTTNCFTPIVKALDVEFGVVSALMSTTHAVTNGQHVVDNFGNERSRSALNNIIPTSTGAARATGKVLKHLDGKLNGTSLRVPVTVGSVVEAVLVVKGTHTTDEVIEALRTQAEHQNRRSVLGKVLYVGDDYQVSADAVGSAWSSMVLTRNAMAIPFDGNTLVKLTSFYDNELGYSHRLAELGIAAMAR